MVALALGKIEKKENGKISALPIRAHKRKFTLTSSFPNNPAEFLALPPPGRSDRKPESAAKLKSTVAHYLNRWTWILENTASVEALSCDWRCPKCGRTRTFTGPDLWNRLLLIVGAYCEHAVRQLMVSTVSTRCDLPPGFNIP